jgi:hypothetical protein
MWAPECTIQTNAGWGGSNILLTAADGYIDASAASFTTIRGGGGSGGSSQITVSGQYIGNLSDNFGIVARSNRGIGIEASDNFKVAADGDVHVQADGEHKDQGATIVHIPAL